jgi:ethanolamine ammonia-lyase small subunit
MSQLISAFCCIGAIVLYVAIRTKLGKLQSLSTMMTFRKDLGKPSSKDQVASNIDMPQNSVFSTRTAEWNLWTEGFGAYQS